MAGPSGGVSGSKLTPMTAPPAEVIDGAPAEVIGGAAAQGCGGFGGLALPMFFPLPFPTASPFCGKRIGGGGGAATNVDPAPANDGRASDGAAALAEPALASPERAEPPPTAGTTVCVKPAPCNSGFVKRLSFAGPAILSMGRRTVAHARTVQRGARGEDFVVILTHVLTPPNRDWV